MCHTWSTEPPRQAESNEKGEKVPFVGRFEHSLDSKHRVVLPRKFRSQLGEAVYLAPQGNSLAVYSEEEFERRSERLVALIESKEVPPAARLALASSSELIELDSAGRITIPRRHREEVGLEGDVVVAGALKHVEIWDRTAFEEHEASMKELLSEQFKDGGTI